MSTLLQKAASLITFSHTIFALPFALAMAVIATRFVDVVAWQVLLIVLALVGARSAAMAWNRLLDAEIDALNPRTKNRDIPAGTVSRPFAWMLIAIASVVFFIASYGLGTHCLVLAPLVLLFLFFYSWTKRFSTGSHLILGIALALAPGGVWYALTAQFALLPLYLMSAVALWVAGFDILYSCQDFHFDRTQGLYSLPAKFGVETAFRMAFVLHILAIAALIAFGLAVPAQRWYFVGVALFSAFLFAQYLMISPKNLQRINQAFFRQNGIASVIFLLFVVLDRVL